MEKLLSTKQIAEMYDVSSYTITQNWCNKGLKFIRGKDGMMFRISWVENFIEREAIRQSDARNHKNIAIINRKPNIIKTTFNKEMKII